jgi:hypothetical protein
MIYAMTERKNVFFKSVNITTSQDETSQGHNVADDTSLRHNIAAQNVADITS